MGRPPIPLDQREKKELIPILDEVFSKYIRLSNANDNGYCECFTCGKKLFWKYIQNGHYLMRSIFLLRWEEDNCRPQCFECNGNMDQRRIFDYRERLIGEIGRERVEEMEGMRHKTSDFEKSDYILMIQGFRAAVAKLVTTVPDSP